MRRKSPASQAGGQRGQRIESEEEVYRNGTGQRNDGDYGQVEEQPQRSELDSQPDSTQAHDRSPPG
ncbi:MAG: hypothetical protein M1565_05975 [Actinobacteria bacterium]|nr:hypothetical protein [Actinomycetota bacterium]